MEASCGDVAALCAPRRGAARHWCQQVGLQLHGLEKRFHGLPRVAEGSMGRMKRSRRDVGHAGRDDLATRAPQSGSALVHGAVDAEERSVKSVKSVQLQFTCFTLEVREVPACRA